MSMYFDVETLTQQWLLTTPVADVTRRPDGNASIFKAMPNGSPKPSIVLTRVGGSPARRIDMPEDIARLSFDCWGNSRAQAWEVASALISHLEYLAQTGSYVSAGGRLVVAETINVQWLADKASDTPRYVVDALVTVIPG